jgi:beta-ureidopropionase / N-carbamoyl-L-amino-acid hydrolase
VPPLAKPSQYVCMMIQPDRLLADLSALAAVGAAGDGGNDRLALTDADASGRELVVGWMRDLGLDVRVDRIGNVVATRAGVDAALAPVMTGSHIDTVPNSGRYDGALGVLAGLETVRALDDAAIRTRRPVAVGLFTDSEGGRFAPTMLGSRVYTGEMPLEEALARRGTDGAVLGRELERIGWAGDAPVPGPVPYAFVELHVEHGPVLHSGVFAIGAVTGVPGISWQELTLTGNLGSGHAGTPMRGQRHDPVFVAGAVVTFVRRLAAELGRGQVGTVGRLAVQPDRVDAVASIAVVSVDLRNPDDAILTEAEERLAAFVTDIARAEGVSARWRRVARFAPVVFDPDIVARVEAAANARRHFVTRLPSGTGHDAHSLARLCPTGMIVVPSRDGIRHHPSEHTEPEDLAAGAEVLLDVLVGLAA